MALRPLSDISRADWFVDSAADWWTKVCLGPPGYETYARVFYDVSEDAAGDADVLTRATLRDILAEHTTTRNECVFGLWDGQPYDDDRWYTGPRISIHTESGRSGHLGAARTFHLFSGPLSEAHHADDTIGVALLWPADHAWFAAGDVDPAWIGVGGTQDLIDELVGDARLDVAPTTYGATDWEDR
jgi:hypothetical protein